MVDLNLDGTCDRRLCREMLLRSATCSTYRAVEITSSTARVADHWARGGYLGRDLAVGGSGHPRRWRDADLEALWALTRLLEVGGDLKARDGSPIRHRFVEVCLETVRARRVNPAGDLLVYDALTHRARRVRPEPGALESSVTGAVLHLEAFRGLEPVGAVLA